MEEMPSCDFCRAASSNAIAGTTIPLASKEQAAANKLSNVTVTARDPSL